MKAGDARKLRRVCVYCGSNPGAQPVYREAARDFGALLAREGMGLVYGGGCVGLMGAVADGALENGGEVVGVMPEGLRAKEVGHAGLTEMRWVASMHERKMAMAELADAFVALPGGAGTMEEIFEVFTWTQLGFHRKPCGFLNVAGFFTPLLGFLDRMVEERFLNEAHRRMLVVAGEGGAMLDALESWEPPAVEKWMDRGAT